MAMATGRHDGANTIWRTLAPGTSSAVSVDHALLAVLMDIREELRVLNTRLGCTETLSIPRVLRRISANTAKPKRRRHRPSQ